MTELNESSKPLADKAVAADKLFKERKVFNDPIYGQIELHPVCCRIIDTLEFQRLRHIKQLDTCYLVYPGASHNRFEHSIGVCYLAGKLLKTIHERQPNEDISEKDILCVEIAGLCHDLGQGPYSHVFEKKFIPKKNKSSEKITHEKLARKMLEYMVEERGLKKAIETTLKECQMPDFDASDYLFIYEMIDDPKDLEQKKWPYQGRGEEKSYMYEIVANKRNGIDVDKWDYLARDSYMLGMKVNVDYSRCFSSARVIKCNGVQGGNDTTIPSRKQICYRDKEAQDLYDMFYTRMTLHRRAYQHKTHASIGMMICDALEAADEHFRIKGTRISETVDDMKAYSYLTDEVIQLIIHDGNEKLKDAKRIIEDILNRRLYKCIKQKRCKQANLTEKKVKYGIIDKLKTTTMPESFFHCDIVKFNFGTADKNPMEKVRFYQKDNLDKAISLDKEQVSFILPDTFEEIVIRLYCKVESDEEKETAKRIKEAFDAWWEEYERSEQTELKQYDQPSQQGLDELKEIPYLPEPAPPQSIEGPPSYSGENIVMRH